MRRREGTKLGLQRTEWNGVDWIDVGQDRVKLEVLKNASFVCYRGADKSSARPTSRCILFEGENISLDASLAIYK